jgi:adenylate kinase
MTMNSTYIILMGVQGSGKGTQAALLKEKLGLPHVSTGDLFRAMKTLDTPLARRVQDLMAGGHLIPDDVTNELVKERLAQTDAEHGVILDGYPRTRDQAEFLEKLLAEKGEQVAAVALFKLDRETAIKRSEGRRYSQDKKRVYNIYFNPPKQAGIDDVDGQSLEQRADDHREAVEKRIDLYFTETAPLIDYYSAKGLLHEINADQPIENVAADMLEIIQQAVAK